MITFTSEQLSAINTRDRTLLVSAAAGSGKTATLTERIIRSILDKNNPININEMLIVTFTRATARELTEKVTNAIKNALAKEPDNERLQKQLNLLPSARISTIDSFCSEILRRNVEKFGITPSYRIADGAEVSILSLSLLNILIEEVFEGKHPIIASPEEFEELSSSLVGVKGDEGLAEQFLLLHEKSKSALQGAKIFRELAKRHHIPENAPLEKNLYVKFSVDLVRDFSSHFIGVFEKISEKITCCNQSEERCAEGIERDINYLKQGLSVKDYLDAQAFLKTPPPKKPSVKSDEITEATALYSLARDNVKAEMGKLYKSLFAFTEKEYRESAQKSHRLITILAKFIEKFDEIYFEEKRRTGALEYSDVERLAMELLYEDGVPSEIALSLREEFRAVYIDEYQDVSPIQNAIFDAISKKDNRFMVGDVKQSIYGFRSARPEIFVDMKNRFPVYCSDAVDEANSIFMSKNFRSDEKIINFVNEIFDKAFFASREAIAYSEGDRLKFGKDAAFVGREPEIHIFTKSDDDLAKDEEEDEKYDESTLTPSFVVNKIKELVANEKLDTGAPVTYSDIAILFRHNDTVKKYKEALEAEGIPCEATGDSDFFLNPDILLMLSLLNVIDNPRRDIYLSALMLSPLFSFTPDELYKIRRENAGVSLYEGVCNYLDKTGDEKCARFLHSLHRYRLISEGISVDTLISRLYAETGILYLASRDGGKNNLMLLYNHAKNYEKNGYRGLYSFINYINTVIESKEKFDVISESTEEACVKISSVHSSKGLEYPIVFLVETQRSTGAIDKRAKISYRESFGIGFKLRAPTHLALVNNPIKNAIAIEQSERNAEEELRVLYVALTRAKEGLYIAGRVKKTKEEFLNSSLIDSIQLDRYSLLSFSSFLDVIKATKDMKNACFHEGLADFDAVCPTPVLKTEKKEESLPTVSKKEIEARFAYKYPYAHHTSLPEKLSISHLYPNVLDEDAEDDVPSIDEKSDAEKKKRPIAPKFISGRSGDESAKAGIATHSFLQFCDFDRLAAYGVKDELQRLTDTGFLSAKDAERVRIPELELFLKSDLFKEIRGAEKIYRELRFNARLPASDFTEDEEKRLALADEKILLQGVIDCIIISPDGSLTLIDYKTDRLTKAELENRELAEKKLKEAHALQLHYYKKAIKEIFGKAPDTTKIYSLPLGDSITV